MADFFSLPIDDAALANGMPPFAIPSKFAGENIGPNDLLIAAITPTHDLTVVTNNREFTTVYGCRRRLDGKRGIQLRTRTYIVNRNLQ